MSGNDPATGGRRFLLPVSERSENFMTILIVGGDTAEIFRQRAADRQAHVEHWSGRKTRDLSKTIPKATDAVVVVLDRVSHALVKKVRIEASRRGLPIYFQKRRRIDISVQHASETLDILLPYQDAS